ncbi:hypothetical protein vBVpaMR16F_88 [Vibrio phage vB_VpaM_R16F]|nr:hypothetical protein vBVpaMR16F_88 [Vibrio phage vB_VpaM_R16F]
MWKLYIEDNGTGHSGMDVEIGVFKEKPSIKNLKSLLINHKKIIGKEGFKILRETGSFQPTISWDTYILEKVEFCD